MHDSDKQNITKGFIAMLDAMFGLIALLLFSTIIFSYLQKGPSFYDAFIYKQGYDILTVLEYTNFSNPSYVFQQTSGSLCMRLEMYNGVGGTLISTYYKTGCDPSNVNEKIAWRTFIDGNQFKTAKLAIWRK
ncbi:MAG: hypothetical protein QXO35_03535 [Candidatus Micrarchaeia archaeon]